MSQADVVKLLEEQRTLLEKQRLVIEDLARRLQELERRTPGASVGAAVEPQLAATEQTIEKRPELKAEEAGTEFPGAFRVPGTNASMRFGGQVRTLLVRTIGALGTEDRFVTSSIPVEGSDDVGKNDRTVLSPSPSRLNTDLRTATPSGELRAFIEGDFAGSNRGYRLRHAFGQWHSFTVGQTWSTFSDPEAEPDGIDFEGLNAISLFRQPLIQWQHPLSARFGLALAIENPSPDLSGATGVNQIPDFIARVRFDRRGRFVPGNPFSGRGHTQLAVLVRQLRGDPLDQPDETLSTSGIGMHLSGRTSVPWRERDSLLFASAAGTGIGRYITDLGTLGGQDAVYDAVTGRLRPLPVYSTYVGYEHWWSETLRSTGTFGTVFVDNLDIQSPDALHYTTRGSFNLAWSPIRRVDLVAELLTGRRVNKDRQDGRASQFQVGWTFRF